MDIVWWDVPIPHDGEAGADASLRLLLAEHVPRYLAAFGDGLLASLRVGSALELGDASLILPEAFRRATLTPEGARHELLTRYVALAGIVSVNDIRARYAFDAAWIAARLEHWTRVGRLIRGTFGFADGVVRYASRRLVEQARRRELARARRAIQAVDLASYARFLERWQHLASDTKLEGEEGTATALRQLYGLARSAEWWEREALRGRVRASSRDAIARLIASGELTWAAVPAPTPGESRMGAVRFFRRGSGRAWLAEPDVTSLSLEARALFEVMRAEGASFFGDLLTITALPSRGLRDNLRELVVAGLVTSDSLDALRMVARWRPIPRRAEAEVDPTRWIPLPADGTRRVVQRRPNLRRLPKWRRPDIEGAEPEQWPGRWSLVHTAGVLGPIGDESAWAEVIARQWLDRYGIVSREHWRRERPAIPWRVIYRELRRLEMRGEAKRGYFVEGLSGAQFAQPLAVEQLRAAAATDDEVILMSSVDPANPYVLPLAAEARDPLSRGRGSVIATIAGVIVVAAESRGSSFRIRAGAKAADVTRAAGALASYLVSRGGRPRDLSVEAIDGEAPGRSPWLEALSAAGFKRTTRALKFYQRL